MYPDGKANKVCSKCVFQANGGGFVGSFSVVSLKGPTISRKVLVGWLLVGEQMGVALFNFPFQLNGIIRLLEYNLMRANLADFKTSK